MRFSIWLSTEQPWDDMLTSARHAERSGWDGVYVADHFMPNGERSSTPRLEAWTAIAGVATAVGRLRVGVLVSGNTYRHPAVLAKMAATVDHLSEGRLVLGLGAGWQVNEHEAYGIELPPPSERLARLDEACQVIRMLHSRERSDFEGRFYTLVDAPCEPKPAQAKLPLLIGGAGEQLTMKVAAKYADEWNCWGLPDLLAHKAEVLAHHCQDIGRDPASIKRSGQALVYMSEDDSRLRELRSQTGPTPRIVGTGEEVLEVMAAYDEIGLDEFVVSDQSLGRNPAEKRDGMDRFFDEVASHMRPSSAGDRRRPV